MNKNFVSVLVLVVAVILYLNIGKANNFELVLPNGDVDSTQCNKLIKEENTHADSVFIPDGPYMFIEVINESKYLYSKKLCLALISRLSKYPNKSGSINDTWIEDLSGHNIFSEISYTTDSSGSTTVWYLGNQTTDYSKTPAVLWKQVLKIQ